MKKERKKEINIPCTVDLKWH